jgi:hypothetical protein
MKNLITDKPSPLTVALSQKLISIEKSKKDIVSELGNANFTKEALKNIVTDKPAPITVSLNKNQ